MRTSPRVLLLGMAMSLLRCPHTAHAYSSGAGSCSGPSGGHGSAAAPGPVSITAPATAVGGSTISVTLSGGSFKGFLLKLSTGNFARYPSGASAASTCGGGGRAATHINGSPKSSLTFEVQLPASGGSVSLSGAVVTQGRRWGTCRLLRTALVG
jgi:hypothetical protein